MKRPVQWFPVMFRGVVHLTLARVVHQSDGTCGQGKCMADAKPSSPIDTAALRALAERAAFVRGDHFEAAKAMVSCAEAVPALCDALDEARAETLAAQAQSEARAAIVDARNRQINKVESERDEAVRAAQILSDQLDQRERERDEVRADLQQAQQDVLYWNEQAGEARAEVERLKEEASDFAATFEQRAAFLADVNATALRSERDDALAEVARLRAALDAIPCPGNHCRAGRVVVAGFGDLRPCETCSGSGKHPAAQAALAGDPRHDAFARLAGELREVSDAFAEDRVEQRRASPLARDPMREALARLAAALRGVASKREGETLASVERRNRAFEAQDGP